MNAPPTTFPKDLARRLGELCAETGDSKVADLKRELEDRLAARSRVAERNDRASIESFRDRLSTRLMEAFRVTGSQLAFGLLYELNYRLFLSVISSRLRKFYFALDPHDVLQEVFFNIYRYPHKFQADKEQAFRHWASMIIRNTVYKCTREKDREACHELPDEEIDARADRRFHTPLGDAIREESERICSRTYVMYLQLYLAAYQLLSTRERAALRMVEVESKPYKVAAQELEIRLENLKMVIFRARKKILRTLDRVLAAAAAWQPEMVGGRQGFDRDDLGGSPELRADVPSTLGRTRRLQPVTRLASPEPEEQAI